MSDVTDDGLTIDDLAREVGMTARNVRAYQSRGLIPPPHLRGRTGYYGPDHVARLELIRDLQAEGFNLVSIRRILERTPAGSVSETLDFTRAVTAPFTDERPEVLDGRVLAEHWGEQLTPELARRIERLGFARPLGEGMYEIRSPRLRRVAEELADLGVSLEMAVKITGTLMKHSEAVARAYVKLFIDEVWRPFEEGGEPSEEWARVREALDRLRPLAGEGLLAVFQLVMTETVEQALERELAHLGEEDGRGRRRRPTPSRRRSTRARPRSRRGS